MEGTIQVHVTVIGTSNNEFVTNKTSCIDGKKSTNSIVGTFPEHEYN